jgi:hypothetical protein
MSASSSYLFNVEYEERLRRGIADPAGACVWIEREAELSGSCQVITTFLSGVFSGALFETAGVFLLILDDGNQVDMYDVRRCLTCGCWVRSARPEPGAGYFIWCDHPKGRVLHHPDESVSLAELDAPLCGLRRIPFSDPTCRG